MSRQLFEYHPLVGFRFIPGLKARVEHEGGGYLVRANQSGFRCEHEFQVARRPGLRRVLLFGDSYTAGDGVSNRDRYGDLLEQLVPHLEVYNFGLPNTGTDQQYLIYREFARDLAPDLVIIAVLVENIRRVAARYRPVADGEGRKLWMAKPYFTLDAAGVPRLAGVPVPREPVPWQALPDEQRAQADRGGRWPWLRRWVNYLGPALKARVQRRAQLQPLPQYNRADHPDWRLLRALLVQWFAEISAPVIVMPVPVYQYIEDLASPAQYRARFNELASPPHVEIHDPLDALRGVPMAERRGYRFATDPHPTPAAHRVLATSLAACLARRWSSLEEPGS